MCFEAAAQQHLLSMALVAAVAAGWCIMVTDFALNVALPQMIRRKALPSGDCDGADALPSAAAPALEGKAGKGEARQVCGLQAVGVSDADDPGVPADVRDEVCGTNPQPEYEVDDPADKASGANARFTGKRDALDDDMSEGA